MTQFLRIVNPTVCPVEGFTTLGMSTNVDDEAAIGQFGSGNKHATLVCLRAGIPLTVFCGTVRLSFFTAPEEVNGKTFQRVYCQQSNRKPERLSIYANYGEQDWQSIGMALREFVSNAIDAAGGTTKGVKIDVQNRITPRPGKTIVGIPLTPDVQQWYNQLSQHFLHFSEKHGALKKKLIEKERASQVLVYRKGVLVRAGGEDDAPSLHNYNLGNEMYIDESRTVSPSQIADCIAKHVAQDAKALENIFRHIADPSTTYYEFDLPEWELQYYGGQNNSEMWQRVWKKVWGAKAVLGMVEEGPLVEMAREKGYRVIPIVAMNWYKALAKAGILCVWNVLDNFDEQGNELIEPTKEDHEMLDRVWLWLELAGVLKDKPKPKLQIFERPMEGGSRRNGFYKDGTIFIHNEDRKTLQTYLEEVAHYITGASDMTRDFQDFAFKVATNIAESAGL